MGYSILVVDDEPNIVLSLEFLMQKAGHQVRVAGSGPEALSAIAEQRPDLVLLDIMLPKSNGYDVCKAIRANPEWHDIPVVMLSAKGGEADREAGLQAGATDFMTKPFSTTEVVDRVEKLLAGRENAG